MTLRVLVADDHSLFRNGIVSLLQAGGMEVVGEAGDGIEAVAQARRLRPDMVLMDIQMPGLNGIEATRQLRAELPEVHVVMLTVSEDDHDLFEAIRAGAEGYLLKSLNADEFIGLLQGLARGEAPIPRRLAGRLMRGLAEQSKTVPVRHNLTERETELLRLVATGLPNKAIGQQLGVSENTVKYHMKNILQKLNLHNRAEAAAYAVQNGLVKSSA